MKLNRILAISASAAVVGASVFAATGAATATPNTPTTAPKPVFVNTPAQLDNTVAPTTPLAPSPSTKWFRYTVGNPAGTGSFGPNGLTVSGGDAQYLNSITESVSNLSAEMVDTGTGDAPASIVVTGTAVFNLALDLNDQGTNSDPALITPAPANTAQDFTATSLWESSKAVGTVAAGTPTPLSTLLTDLNTAYPTAQAVAYGFAGAANSSVQGIEFNYATTYFTPTPAGTATPNTLTVSAWHTTGVTLHLSGFFPGETVQAVLATQTSGGPVAGVTYTADANGDVNAQFVDPNAADGPNTYAVGGVGETSNIAVAVPVDVTADPTTPAAPPATPISAAAPFTG